MGRGKQEELILYIGIVKHKFVIASSGKRDVSFDKQTLEAALDVPLHCRSYSMGFDEISLLYMREQGDPDLLYVMGYHAALRKETALKLLSELREYYLQSSVGRGIFRGQSADMSQVRKKLEDKIRSIIENTKGVIPPREDLIIYKNAPDAYLVHKGGDDDGPPIRSPPSPTPPTPGRKSLQEELAELGDDDSESDISVHTSGTKPKSMPRPLPTAPLELQTQQAQFPFSKAKLAKANSKSWSVQMNKRGGVTHATPANPPPAAKPDAAATWSMDYSIWTEKMNKGRSTSHFVGPVAPPPSKSSAARTAELVKWAESKGGLPLPEGLLEHMNLSASKSPRATPPAASPPAENNQAQFQAEASRKPLPILRPMMSSNNIQPQHKGYVWNNDARVSPDESLQREVKSDVFANRNKQLGFVSEREPPTPGRISALAPSGLSWEEEIRRHQVAQGLAPPRASAGDYDAEGFAKNKEKNKTRGSLDHNVAHIAPSTSAMDRRQHRVESWKQGAEGHQVSDSHKSSFCCF